MRQLLAEALDDLFNRVSVFYEKLDNEMVGVRALCFREELSRLSDLSLEYLQVKDHGSSVFVRGYLNLTVLFDHPDWFGVLKCL